MRKKSSGIKKYVSAAACLFVLFSLNYAAHFAKATEDTATSSPTREEELSQSQKDLLALQKTIADKNAQMTALQAEIDNYKKQIEQTGTQAKNLKGAIKLLEATKSKLGADIQLTQKKIESTNLNIERLGIAITEKKSKITESIRTLAEAISLVNDIDKRTAVEIILANENLYDGWNDFEDLQKFQGSVNDQIEHLIALKRSLEDNKMQTEQERKKLTSLKSTLSDQRLIVDQNKKQQNKLLTDTKNKESEYQKLLADRLAKKNALEQEILEFEAQLKATVDISLLPKVGRGILSYPMNSVRITQYFGNTPFSTANPQVYSGMGHNGVDFAASSGSLVKSAGNGIVIDTGNTDTQCYGVSYGKWVLVRHPNGLSTLYAHLSVMKVGAGDGVEKGQVIGYSGNTGYTTGPHLHFAVFASQGVHISGPYEYKSKICGTYMKLPVAPRNAYLNPLSYL